MFTQSAQRKIQRKEKQRNTKPFAVLCETLRALCVNLRFKLNIKILSFITLFVFALVSVDAQQTAYFPKPLGFINDYENDFNADERKTLDAAVKDLLTQTMERVKLKGIEIAVVTVTDSMYGDSKEMSTYATMLGDKWGVGTKTPNRGIIIAYSKKLRKVSVVTGAGLDELLPKEVCNSIVNEKMAAAFKQGGPYAALLVAVKSIAEYLGVPVK